VQRRVPPSVSGALALQNVLSAAERHCWHPALTRFLCNVLYPAKSRGAARRGSPATTRRAPANSISGTSSTGMFHSVSQILCGGPTSCRANAANSVTKFFLSFIHVQTLGGSLQSASPGRCSVLCQDLKGQRCWGWHWRHVERREREKSAGLGAPHLLWTLLTATCRAAVPCGCSPPSLDPHGVSGQKFSEMPRQALHPRRIAERRNGSPGATPVPAGRAAKTATGIACAWHLPEGRASALGGYESLPLSMTASP
jgi:hypothetical protein